MKKMASFGALIFLSVTLFFVSDADGQTQLPQYSTRWNNLNIDQILSSDRLVTNYVECLLSRKPCPPEGKDLKRILPEALRTKCARCSPQQMEGALRVITKLHNDYPLQYDRLRAKWDPTGEYHRRFEEYLRGLQFNTINNESSTQISNSINVAKNKSIIASASSNNQNVVTTNLPGNTAQFNNTQRPARNPEIGQETRPLPTGIFNRFGSDDDSAGNSDTNTAKTSTISTTTSERTTSAMPSPSQRTTKRPAKRPNSVNESPTMVRQHNKHSKVDKNSQPSIEYTVYTYNTQPDVVYIQQHPLIGLINSIGYKISNTADFFAGMLRGTIQKS